MTRRPALVLQDQQFSAQDKRQLYGRIWRHPQLRICIIYDLIALSTSDVILNEMARGKKEMLTTFVTSSPFAEGTTADRDTCFSQLFSQLLPEMTRAALGVQEENAQDDGQEPIDVDGPAAGGRSSRSKKTAKTTADTRRPAAANQSTPVVTPLTTPGHAATAKPKPVPRLLKTTLPASIPPSEKTAEAEERGAEKKGEKPAQISPHRPS